jgi:hypothetical protein
MAAAAIAAPAPAECTVESHEAAKASLEAYLASVINLRPWPGIGLMGECACCPHDKPSTLLFGLDDDEAAAVIASARR